MIYLIFSFEHRMSYITQTVYEIRHEYSRFKALRLRILLFMELELTFKIEMWQTTKYAKLMNYIEYYY